MSDIRDAVLTDHMITFGPDQHPIPSAVMMIHGCDEEQARAIALALYGQHWSGLYSGREADRYRATYSYAVVLTVDITGPDAS
jgi:hypothetical protein